MTFDWSQLSFILGNLLGMFIKNRPNTGIWKDKYIPLAIFVLMLVVQFLKAVIDAATGTPITPTADAGTHAIVYASLWGSVKPVLLLFWAAFKQAAIAVFINEAKKQQAKAA